MLVIKIGFLFFLGYISLETPGYFPPSLDGTQCNVGSAGLVCLILGESNQGTVQCVGLPVAPLQQWHQQHQHTELTLMADRVQNYKHRLYIEDDIMVIQFLYDRFLFFLSLILQFSPFRVSVVVSIVACMIQHIRYKKWIHISLLQCSWEMDSC